MKNAKRLLSGLVSAAMCMSLLPAAVMTNASAEEADKVLLLGDSKPVPRRRRGRRCRRRNRCFGCLQRRHGRFRRCGGH